MNKFNTSGLFPLIALIILILILSNEFFKIPPLGKLLDPFNGIVQNEEKTGCVSSKLVLAEMGLSDSVHVFFDERQVPHIFAKNSADLYFAQGYITAYLRLWQMDFLTYVAAGRISEIFNGGEFLKYDRMQRRIGILEAAQQSLKLIEKNQETIDVLSAYSKGVNAFIEQLSYKKLPLEYKLLDYKPETWTNLKSVLILKQMGNILSGYEEDAGLTNMILALGEENFNRLFPEYNPYSSPFINCKPAPKRPWIPFKKPEYLDCSFLLSNSVFSKNLYNPTLGSNNWVVSGKKTKSGFPILCSDPHLDFTLPCIWVEMQLTSPNVNVYGVSIPGTPSIIIGFNEKIAWGVTNGASDVKDWYKLKITHDFTKYEFDGNWNKLNYKIEEIKRRGQKVFYDTIYQTVHGPIVINKSFPEKPELMNYALKWELHNPSNEFLTFIKLNKAKNVVDYKDALSYYACPIQNFAFACNNNDIAITHQGKLACKWPGQGRYILDGTKSSHLYAHYIPNDSLPQIVNPECNYVFSANQRPTDSNYGYYYDGFYSEARGNQIKKELEKENKFDIPKMETLQLNNINAIAVEALPVLLKIINGNSSDENQKKIITMLDKWNGGYNFNDKSAVFFELWWKNIKNYTWTDLKAYSFSMRAPDDYILLTLIKDDPSSKYFDKHGTSIKENAYDIVQESFHLAVKDYDEMKKKGSMEWSNYNKISIMHMTYIDAFSRTDLPSAGYYQSINAISKREGPSWRMIVELGDRPKAYGVYPGGQSGNIGSKYYDNFINDWSEGKYYELKFFMSAAEARKHTTNTWILK